MNVSTAPARPAAHGGRLAPLFMSFAVLAAAVVGLIVRGPTTADALVYTLSFREGESRTYDFKMDMHITPRDIPDFSETLDMSMSSKMTMRAVDVRDDGSTELELTVSDVQVSESSGLGAPDAGSESMRMVVSPRGEILSVDGGDVFGEMDLGELLGVPTEESGGFGSMSLFPTFPEEAVGPGDTWETTEDVPFPFGDGKVSLSMQGEHQGFQDSERGRVARMYMKMQMPLDINFSFADIAAFGGEDLGDIRPGLFDSARMIISGAMNGDMTALVPPDGSDLVRMQADMKMDMSMRLEGFPAEVTEQMPSSFGMLMDMRMQMSRIS